MPARTGTAHVVTTTRKYKDQVLQTRNRSRLWICFSKSACRQKLEPGNHDKCLSQKGKLAQAAGELRTNRKGTGDPAKRFWPKRRNGSSRPCSIGLWSAMRAAHVPDPCTRIEHASCSISARQPGLPSTPSNEANTSPIGRYRGLPRVWLHLEQRVSRTDAGRAYALESLPPAPKPKKLTRYPDFRRVSECYEDFAPNLGIQFPAYEERGQPWRHSAGYRMYCGSKWSEWGATSKASGPRPKRRPRRATRPYCGSAAPPAVSAAQNSP